MKVGNRHNPRFVVYASTIILILLFSIYQYQSYKTNLALTDQQLRLNTLRGRMIHLDEALTMSARLYILEKDETWKNRYDRFAIEYVSSQEEINKKLPEAYNGKKELSSASDQLFALETKAFAHAKQNHYDEARAVLFGAYYIQQSKDYQTALAKLTTEIDRLSKELLSTHREKTIFQSLLALLILLGVVTGWSFYIHISNKWHKKINEINIEKAEAAMAAEKKLQGLNAQLHLLSAHLQAVREKEKQHIAYEISEEVGQQLMAFKMNYTTTQRQLLDGEAAPLNHIQKATDQLDSVLLYLNELALDVYPSILKDLGLIEALSWEIERLADQKNISIIFFTEEDDLMVESSVVYRPLIN